MVSNFTLELKLCVKACCDQDIVILQWNVERSSEWAEDQQIGFNVGECEVLHFGKRINRQIII